MENIIYLLSCYFHQDWRCDAKNSDEIIELFAKKESQNTINKLKVELEYFINGNEDLTVKGWFKRVLDILNKNL